MVGSTQVVEEAQMIAAIVRDETHLFHDRVRPFVKAFRNLSKLRAESSFSTWLIRIALNELRSKLRQKKSMKRESLDAGSEEDGRVSPAIPVDALNFRVETECTYRGSGCDGKLVTVHCVPGANGSLQLCR